MRRLFAFALLLAAGPVHARPTYPERVDVVLRSFGFAPAQLMLHHGGSYVLHLTNSASGGHDLSAKAFFTAAQIDPADRSLVRNGGVEVEGGATVDIRFVAPAPGRYEVRCSHFMHSAFGMKGAIIVD